MAKYIKCPRCEINYIHEGEELCDVCKAELKLGGIELLDEDEYDEDLIPCPICKENYIPANQDMCDECRAKLNAEEETEKEDEWVKDPEDIEMLGEDEELSLDQMSDDELDQDHDDEKTEE